MREKSIPPLQRRKLQRWHVPTEASSLHDERNGLESADYNMEYRYRPLTDGTIRVLYIEPAQDLEDPIHCMLKHGPIRWTDEFDPYITLSYCWGDPALNKILHCDGAFIRITSNLENALRYIRQKQDLISQNLFAEPGYGSRVPIWIDGICINQADMAERTDQVKQMAAIYSNSSRLVVWLGMTTKAAIATPQESRGIPSSTEPKEEDIEEDMLKSPWFSRRWVIEEYALTPPNSRFFLLGSAWFPCSLLTNAPESELNESQLAFARYRELAYHESDSLLYNLYRFDGAICSMAHDLIYSLLPLSFSSAEVASVGIDYSQPIDDLLIDVARSIVEAKDVRIERLGLVLAVASAKNARGPPDSLPSWVPDWRIASRYHTKEHRETVESMLDLLGHERSPERSGARNGMEVQRREQGYPEGLTAVEGRCLVLRGRFLRPCFPPWHRRASGGYYIAMHDGHDETTQYCGPQDDHRCSTCQLCELWEFLEPEDHAALKAIDEARQTLFMIPRSPVVFVLNRCQEVSPNLFKLAWCFRASYRLPRARGSYPGEDARNLEADSKFREVREQIFESCEEITLV